ncbi:ROK family protein [Leifsonia sp. A12D58]|uniref:ROK family transcriptional regulator n=1 Tax=Leifsonia sp. A12D58 TaxID=3397674 RepID=UPI0039DF90C0
MTALRGNDVATLRWINSRAVLTELMHSADVPLSVTELASRIELSRPTVEAALTDLVTEEWVVEATGQSQPHRAGRPARHYSFNAAAGLVMGIDIGPHSIVGLLTDLSGTVLHEVRRHDLDLASGDAAMTAILDAVAAAVDAVGTSVSRIRVITVGVPAIVSNDGEIALTTVVPDWLLSGIPERIRAAFPGSITFFDNDAKLATLAEAEWGAASGTQTALFILAGRRIAAGLIVNGQLMRGTRGAAGEIGALQGVGWATSFARFSDRISASHDADSGTAPGLEAVMIAAVAGDEPARAVAAGFAEDIAEGVAALILTIDPEVVVIGGGCARAGDTFLAPLRAALEPLCIYTPPLVASSLGSKAVALGAVARSLDHMRNEVLALGLS